MNPRHPFGGVALRFFVLLALVACTRAQESAPVPARRIGVPQDWSQSHIIFSRDGLLRHPDLIYREPRILHQVMQRWQAPNSNIVRGVPPVPAGGSGNGRDWSVNFAAGRPSVNMYPAKFSFDPSAPPDCTNDFVVFGLATVGATNGHPNLIAFNNLYVNAAGTGFCPGTAPNVLFAYNITTPTTTGKILTSPIISEDGKQIAFVESLGTSAIFHTLRWAAGAGTRTVAAAPPASMTSLTYTSTANSTTSSPYIDYSRDIVYLGSDKGLVYKIKPVFTGTPALPGVPWPVTISNNFHLTPPVLDTNLGLLMVGSGNGNLYQINTTTAAFSALIVGKSGTTNPGITAAPIVDVTNGTTFVISADDGTSATLVEADTASLTQLAKVSIGVGSAPVGGVSTPLSIYEPAVDNNYFNDPSTGQLHTCGTGAADITPWMYSFGFTGRTMKTTASFSQQLLTSTNARCTAWTEFFNPNIGGGTDFFFFGLTQDCTATGTAGGCLATLTGTNTITNTTLTGGPSGIVVDNYSLDAEASSIYLAGRNVNTAYKILQ